MDAVICFNEGVHVRTKVLKELKINPGNNTYEGLRKSDKLEICKANVTAQKASKEANNIERQNKRKNDALEEFLQEEYKFLKINF
ncbi:hypothetical protein TNCV_4905671 [Trichonephila clavipes]|uniref:Uncharacterized protein n=1 Tax=Trichonephila clavipes TaxID=2585209 RepID=A0A8X6RM24_TRICX|nr:hypothetical protein TNCV_4905671 [Trichonephila clavipes]